MLHGKLRKKWISYIMTSILPKTGGHTIFRQTAARPFQAALIFLLFAAMLVSCAPESTENGKEGYMQITPEQAKEFMDNQEDCVILDVRTQEEFDAGHIPGAILIPDYEITAKAEATLPDKEQLILVYCRSGRRSMNAAEELAAMGYTNVKEFGGILSWPYETVSEH